MIWADKGFNISAGTGQSPRASHEEGISGTDAGTTLIGGPRSNFTNTPKRSGSGLEIRLL